MSYALLALLLLAGFIGLAMDSTPSVRQDALAQGEEDLRLRVVNPTLRRFNEQGLLDTTLQAPEASDYGSARPAHLATPQLQWPQRGWQARSDRGSISPDETLLLGNAVALQPATQRELRAPSIRQRGDVLLAPQGQINSPDFTGQAEQVTINTQTQVVTLTDQVETRLWPAR